MNYNKIPKIDLHCHLDGSVRPQTLLELSLKKGIRGPETTLSKVLNEAKVPENCGSLVEYLQRFELPLAVMQNKDSLVRIANEFILDCHADGLKYVEVRFAPVLHLQESLSFEGAIEAVLEGLSMGRSQTGLPFGLIMCCMRHMSPEETKEHVKRTIPYIGQGVVAADLAGDEAHFPPVLHRGAFELARSHDMNITVHAGETGIAENIRDSISLLYASRIGHGTSAYKIPALLDALIEKNITLEMCPTSNLHTKSVTAISQHPLKDYLDKGLSVTLNTDNRTVSDITATEELEKVHHALHLTEDDMKKLYINAANGAFVDAAVRQQLVAQWK